MRVPVLLIYNIWPGFRKMLQNGRVLLTINAPHDVHKTLQSRQKVIEAEMIKSTTERQKLTFPRWNSQTTVGFLKNTSSKTFLEILQV